MLPSESGDISSDPEVDFDPDQPPLALQDVAFAEDQETVTFPPTTNWLISVLTVTVGDTATGALGPPPPPQADNKVVRINGAATLIALTPIKALYKNRKTFVKI
tara:strand:- start:156 stop:467 length:312 start_codon:yes stop_codon:yes gene_type:complete